MLETMDCCRFRERESSISQKLLLLLLTMSAAMIGGTGLVTSNEGETKKQQQNDA
jgi:hypothetical protein